MSSLVPINKHLIPSKPRDRGGAFVATSLQQQVVVQQGTQGVVGTAATVTGATIASDNTGERVLVQGPDAAGPATYTSTFYTGGGDDPTGVFILDSEGELAVALTPFVGLTIVASGESYNEITWVTPAAAAEIATISASEIFGEEGDTSLVLQAVSADGASTATLIIYAPASGRGAPFIEFNGTHITVP